MGRDGNPKAARSGNPSSFSELASLSPGKIDRFSQVHAGELSLVDHHAPIDDRRPDVAG